MKVLGLDEVRHVLGPGVEVLGVVVVVAVRVVLSRADVVHLVCRAALHAAGNGLLAGQLRHVSFLHICFDCNGCSYSDPEHVVRVGRATSAANVLLVTSRVDNDGVLHGACNSSATRSRISTSSSTIFR